MVQVYGLILFLRYHDQVSKCFRHSRYLTGARVRQNPNQYHDTLNPETLNSKPLHP